MVEDHNILEINSKSYIDLGSVLNVMNVGYESIGSNVRGTIINPVSTTRLITTPLNEYQISVLKVQFHDLKVIS